MDKFEVTIGKAKYEVTAPDEKTAWEWANLKHNSAPEPYDIPAGVKSLMNVGQGMSFDWGDEIAGALPGVDKARYRATLEDFQKEYPKSAMLGQISGSMLMPFGAGKLAATMPWTAAATVGGLGGLAQGAGDAKTLESAPHDAFRGGALGAVAGPALFGIGSLGGNAASALGTKLPLVGDALTQSLARRRVAEAFMRDSTDAERVGKKMVGIGAEARFADAAGENTRTVIDLNANLPGKTQEDLSRVIHNRIATRPERMDDVVYAVNSGMGRAGAVTSALSEQQKKVAGPLYDKLRTMEVSPSPQLIRDMEAAKKLGAWADAEKIALAEDIPFTLSVSHQKLGDGKIGMKDADLIKRGIDSLIDGQTDAVTGKVTALGRTYVILKKRLTGELDTLTKDASGDSVYAAARDAFAGPAALKTAIDKGRAFWHEDAPKIGELMDGMSKSEQDAFRIGAAEALRGKVGSQAGQNQLLNIWKDRNTREKLQVLLGDDVKYADVENMLAHEGMLKPLESLGVGRNSRTASRLFSAEDQGTKIAEDLVANGGRPLGLTRMLLDNVLGYAKATPEPVRDTIGKILLKQYSPAEIKALMDAQEALRKYRSSGSIGAGVAGAKSQELFK